MVKDDYHTLLRQSQIASKAIARQGKLLDALNTALGIAKQLIQFCRQHPQAALVAVNTVRQEPSVSAPLPLKTALIATVLGQRNRFNDHYLQHLVGATYLLFCCASYHKDTARLHFDTSLLQGLKQRVSSARLAIWQQVFAVCPLLGRPQFVRYLKSPVLTQAQWWVVSCAHISVHFQQRFFPVLRQIVQHSPARREALVQPWLAFPGDIWPGAQLSAHPETRVVLAKTAQRYAIITPQQTQLSLDWQGVPGGNPIRFVSFNQWYEWAQRCIEELKPAEAYKPGGRVYPLSHPPASLVQIIDDLRDPDLAINKLTARLEAEPAFARALTAAASVDNRLGLPVSDIKQAVLTYGLDRVGDMLFREALMQRLLQHYFPLAETCLTLLDVSANLASHIAADTTTQLTPQSAGLVSTFLLAPLFSLPALKVLPRFAHQPRALHDINTLVALKTPHSFSQFAAELAVSWHLPGLHRAIIHQMGKYPSAVSEGVGKEAAVIMLSLLQARCWLFNGGTLDDTSAEAQRQCMHLLGLKPQALSAYRTQLSARLALPLLD